jgi:hypothetical protein
MPESKPPERVQTQFWDLWNAHRNTVAADAKPLDKVVVFDMSYPPEKRRREGGKYCLACGTSTDYGIPIRWGFVMQLSEEGAGPFARMEDTTPGRARSGGRGSSSSKGFARVRGGRQPGRDTPCY